MPASQIRVVGWIGLATVICFVAGFAVDPLPPGAGSTAAQYASHAVQFSAADRAAGFLFALSATGLVVLIAGLRQWLLDISPAPRWWGTAMLAGAILAAMMLLIGAVGFFATGAHPPANNDTAAFLGDELNYTFIFAGFGALVLLVFASASLLVMFGPLQLLGRVGVVIAALQVPYLLTAFFTSGPLQAGSIISIIGFGAAGVFVLLLSVTLLVFARLMAAAGAPRHQ